MAAAGEPTRMEGADMRIRMLLVAGLLAVPGLVMAQSQTDTSDRPDYGSSGSMQDKQQSGSMGQGSEMRTSNQQMGQMSPQIEVFKKNKRENFELKGTVSSVDSTNNTITVQREKNLPPVELQVAQGTDIKWDGKQASLNQLQPGSEVRARFNLANDQPVAIELDAKQARGQKHQQQQQQQMNR